LGSFNDPKMESAGDDEKGGGSVSKIRLGDRVWIKNPQVLTERKVGTIVAAKNTGNGIRYLVEWEVNLVEEPNGHHPGYRPNEIVPIRRGNP
jgi:hypothetical protein